MGNQRIEPVSPRLLLALWRERWGKAGSASARVPYIKVKLTDWEDRLTSFSVLSKPGAGWIMLLCCLALFFLTVDVALTVPGQIIFSACLAGVALYLRRYEGMLITLVLASLSMLASARYFDWRFSSVMGQNLTFDTLLALGLCFAELFFWTAGALGFVTAVWPLKRASVHLPPEAQTWPAVDVYIPVCGETLRVIKEITAAAMALEWPANKLKIYLLDDHSRAEVSEFAESSGVRYLPLPETPGGQAELIYQAASLTGGALIALLQCQQHPEPKLLTLTIGWFMEDLKLGMIQTPHHGLAPEVSTACLDMCLDYSLAAPCALIRRSAIVAPEHSGSSTDGSPEFLKLKGLEYRHSMIGMVTAKNERIHESDKTLIQENKRSSDFFLMDDPFSDKRLRIKKIIVSLRDFFYFYHLFPIVIFFTAPLAYLLGDIDVIQAAPAMVLAYFLPHFLHVFFAINRLDSKSRLTIGIDIKELVLSCYFLIPTVLVFARTKFREFKYIFSSKKPHQSEPFDRLVAWPLGIVIGLNLVGFLVGAKHLLLSGGRPETLALISMVWALFNFALLTATWAIAEESRQIRQHITRQRTQDAMIQLPTGRTITGVTQNFPSLALSVNLPVKAKLEVGTLIGISIFRDLKEFTFSAQVVVNDDQDFLVAISKKSQSTYEALGVLALSRNEQWPQFLPGPRADQPLPQWVSQSIVTVFGQVSDTVERWALVRKLSLLASRINYWKKST